MTCPTREMLDACMPTLPLDPIPPAVNGLIEDVIADALDMQAAHMERKDGPSDE